MPILRWLQYADPRLAPYGRSATRIERGFVEHGQTIWVTIFTLAHFVGEHGSLAAGLEDEPLAALSAASARLSPKVQGFLACTAEALRAGDFDAAVAAMMATYSERWSEVLAAGLPRLVVEPR